MIPPPASDLDDEVEPSLARALSGHAHLEVRAVEAVAAVAGLVAEVELRRENAFSGRLHLDVDMPGAPGVFRRNDGLQAIAPFGVGELVAATAKAAIVVLAVLVRVPEIEQGVGHGLASGGQDLSRHDQPRGLGLRLHQRNAARRIGSEKWALSLRRRELAAGKGARLRKARNDRERDRGGKEPAAYQRDHRLTARNATPRARPGRRACTLRFRGDCNFPSRTRRRRPAACSRERSGSWTPRLRLAQSQRRAASAWTGIPCRRRVPSP